MGKEIRIRITKDGKVEVDSSVFEDCMEVAEKLKNLLGKVEKFDAKEDIELSSEERIKIEGE